MKFSALVIEPSRSNRSYLWQALLAESSFERVRAIDDLDGALAHLQSGAGYDVVLASSDFPREKIGAFVKKARESAGGTESAYVTVVRKAGQTRENVAFGLVDGTDGFLFVPFSVHTLREVAVIASAVKKEHEHKRRLAALKLLLAEVRVTFSKVVTAMHCEEETAGMRHALATVGVSLKKIKEEDSALYYEVLLPHLENANPYYEVLYKGASARIRKKLKKQIASRRE